MLSRFLRSASTWNLVGLVALAMICLSPTLITGYLSDDTVTSLTPGMRRYAGIGLVPWIASAIKTSTLGGRFYPLHWVAFHGVFAVFQDVYSYKIFIIVCVIVDLLLFVALIRKLGGDAGLATLAASLTILAFQLRAFHDPILSFFGLLQFLVAATLLSLMALERYLDGQGRRWLVVAAGLYLGSCLTYELSYPLFLLHAFLIALRKPGWRSWAVSSLPFAASAGSCAFISILVRKLPTAEVAAGYATNLEPTAVISTLAKQAASAIPLSYFSTDPSLLFWGVKAPGPLLNWLLQPEPIGVVLAASVVSYLGLRRPVEPGNGRTKGALIGLGLLMAVLPGVMIAITRRYQREVSIGNGYVPVYIQYFGVALLLATAIRALLSRIRPGLPAIAARSSIALLFGLATALTYLSNSATALSLVSPPGSATYNLYAFGMTGGWHYQRLNIEAALDAGLMDDVPEHSRVYLTNEYKWFHEGIYSAFFYAKHTSKELVTIPPSARDLGSPKAEFLRIILSRGNIPDRPRFVVRDVCSGPKSGFVVLSEEDGGGELKLFVRRPRLTDPRNVPAFLVSAEPANADREVPYLKRARDLRLLKSGPDWCLFSLKDAAGLVIADSIRPVFDPVEGTKLVEARDRALISRAEKRKDVIAR